MPRLGESVTEGTVTRWLKKVGDALSVDEPLLEVSTDKVDTEVPSPASGTLLAIKVAEDETVEIGVELAIIGDAAEAPAGSGAVTETPGGSAVTETPVPAAEQPPAPPASAPPAPAPAPAPPAPAAATPPPAPAPAPIAPPVAAAAAPPAPTHAAPPQAAPPASASPAPAQVEEQPDEDALAYVTPLVRKLAGEHGINLADLIGTGIGGRIRKSDVLAAAEAARQVAEAARLATAPAPAASAAPTAPAPSPAAAGATRGRTEPLSRMRTVIAARMVDSLRISAQLTTVVEVDVTRIAGLRDAAQAGFETREGVRLTFLPFFAAAAVEALQAHPSLNASIDTAAGTVTYHDAEHLGIAVDAERGLAVPVIHHAGDLSLAGLARKIADLADRTRTNRLTPDELGGGTFTLTNTGSRGALFDTPIINQPQVAILGTGLVVKRPVVVSHPDLGDTIAVRSMVHLALTYDHRLIDGADAARFLAAVKERLEAGAFEGELGL
jgi:2-oxoglutarate dehydrogenase E2 component (dihydrolipoamide succinyltransferase)